MFSAYLGPELRRTAYKLQSRRLFSIRRAFWTQRGVFCLEHGAFLPNRGGRRNVAMAASIPAQEVCGIATDANFNIPPNVIAKVGAGLLLKSKHPLGILWKAVQDYFAGQDPSCKFYDRDNPVVTTKQCFDELLVPPEHPSRSPSDTYYVNADTVLRTHTSAHQCQYMKRYPECEGVRLFDAEEVSAEDVEVDLKRTLEGLAACLFQLKIGEDSMRWLNDYFPFTEPSFELEVMYDKKWLEVLGCGVIHHEVLRNAGLDPARVRGWAFGLGLERLAMVLFGIPDIRLFWSVDPRFSEQFSGNSFTLKTKFKPFSKYPPVMKDISMWIPENFIENDFFEMIRDEGGDQVEKVDLMDEFTHPKTGRRSRMFRVTWRDMSRTLTNEEVNAKHELVLARIVNELQVELR